MTTAVRTPARVVANPISGPVPVWSPYTREPQELHRRLPGYVPTPLLSAPSLAARLGVGELLIKYERSRFGLPAFKMLGASWAVYRAVVERAGAGHPAWSDVSELAGAWRSMTPLTLVAATDGNHGRAVARMARLVGFDARIFVPAGTSRARIDAIASEGAVVTVVDGDYEAAVSASAAHAGDRCLLISDTSWPGYERVPRWVIEGYSTMFFEIGDRLEAAGRHAPDGVVVPIGVGALAAAAVNHWCRGVDSAPSIVGVEPVGANAVMASIEAGQIVTVPGPHRSIMAGLNCGTPSMVAWPLMSAGIGTFVAIDDEWARAAVRDLAGVGVEAGETGAAALAGLAALQASREPAFGADATVLVICTEGPTDEDAWRAILGVKAV